MEVAQQKYSLQDELVSNIERYIEEANIKGKTTAAVFNLLNSGKMLFDWKDTANDMRSHLEGLLALLVDQDVSSRLTMYSSTSYAFVLSHLIYFFRAISEEDLQDELTFHEVTTRLFSSQEKDVMLIMSQGYIDKLRIHQFANVVISGH